MKKIIKTFIVFNLIIFSMATCYIIKTYAVVGGIDTNLYTPTNNLSAPAGALTKAGNFVAALQLVGIIIAVIGILIIGIKFMMGSVEEKAQYKKTMVPYIVGLIFIVCTTSIVNIIYNITNGTINS